MSELVTQLASPAWWISTVIAAVAVNLIAAYLKPSLDNRLSRSWKWWRLRSESARNEEYEIAAHVSASTAEQILTILRAVYLLVCVVVCFILGTFSILMPSAVRLYFRLESGVPAALNLCVAVVAGALFLILFYTGYVLLRRSTKLHSIFMLSQHLPQCSGSKEAVKPKRQRRSRKKPLEPPQTQEQPPAS